jgi:hypothetical protein
MPKWKFELLCHGGQIEEKLTITIEIPLGKKY